MTTATLGLPVLKGDPFDVAVLNDPYPYQAKLRELGPVFWVEEYGHYGVAWWEPIHHILNTWQDYTATHGVGLSDITQPDSWREKGALVEEDPPIHTNIRVPMQRIMSPTRVRGWRDALLAAANDLLDETMAAGDFDAVPDLGEAFAMRALPMMLGVDAHRTNLLAIGDHNFNSIGPRNAIYQKTADKVEEINRWYEEAASQDSMHPGGMGVDFFKAEEEGLFEPGMAYRIVRMLLRGGFDTTISGLTSVLMQFALNPDQFELVKINRKLGVRAFEEALRLESPAQTLFRTVNPGVELMGIPLEAGHKIQYWLASGNRDPRKWDEPDAFRVERDITPSLAFGGGVHKCIGSMVARIEAEAMIEVLAERVKRVEIVGDYTYRLNNSLRTLNSLPIRLIPN